MSGKVQWYVVAYGGNQPCPVVPRPGHIGFWEAGGVTGVDVHPEVADVLLDLATGLRFSGPTPDLVPVPPSDEARALLAAVLAGRGPDDDEDDDEPAEGTDIHYDVPPEHGDPVGGRPAVVVTWPPGARVTEDDGAAD
jgi:hypothetical protein